MSVLQDSINRLLRPVKNRISGLIGRAVLTYLVDSGDFQVMQADRQADETSDDLERMGWYGLASRPQAGAELIVLSAGGVRSHGIVIACEDRRYRMKLEADGEVAIYDDLDQVVHLKRDGIRVSSSMKVDIEAPQINLTGDVLIDGNLCVDGDMATTGDLEVDGDTSLTGDLNVDGNSVLGLGATLPALRSDMSPATKVIIK